MSTLTPEQHAEQAWVEWNADDGPSCSLVEHIFLAGMRYQHERTREAAAKVCEGTVKREPEYGGRWGGYGSFDGPMTAKECVEAIRALTLDEC